MHHQLANQLPLYRGSPFLRLLFQEDRASLISLNVYNAEMGS